ncbi:MAG TPA: phosphopantetheine-binding protein [Streptosporangiaceae bacterium]
MSIGGEQASVPVAEPEGMAERTLTGIWCKVLNTPGVSGNDNFFALGGNSVKLIEMVALARQAGLEITLTQAFENMTVAELAKACRAGSPEPEPELVREVVFGNLSSPWRCYLILTSGEDLAIVQNITGQPGLAGIALHVLMPLWREAEPYITAAEMSGRFARRIRQQATECGIVIAGHSAAGSVAARVAIDLARCGHLIRHLILLESPVPEPLQRCVRLDDSMPRDRSAPEVLRDLRAEMARISDLRSAGAMPPAEAMAAAWRAVSAEALTVLLLIYGPEARTWADSTRAEAARNFLAWLNVVVGLAEPLPGRLPANARATLLLNSAINEVISADWRKKWQEELGVPVQLNHQLGGHRGLLYCEEFIRSLTSSFPGPMTAPQAR